MTQGSARRSFARTGSAFVVATVLQSSAAVLILPFLTRTLDSAALGELAAAQLVTLLVSYVVSLGLSAAVTREYFHEDGEARARRLIGLICVVAPVVTLVLHVFGPVWSKLFDSIGYDGTLEVAVWTAWPRVIVIAGLALFRAQLRSAAFVAIAVTSAVGSQLAGLVLLQQDPVVLRYVVGVALVQAVLAGFVIIVTRPRFDRLAGIAKVALPYALPVALHSTAGLVVTTGDRVLIERELGLDAVGRYQVAYMVGSLGILVLLAVNNAWGPLVLGTEDARRRETLATTTALLFRLIAASCVLLVALVPVGLRLLAPASYRPDELVLVSSIVVFATLPMVLYLAGNHAMMIERRTARLAVSTVAGAIVNVAGNMILIPSFGLHGAAVATVASYATWAVILQMAPASRQVPWRTRRHAPEVLVAGAVMVALSVTPTTGWGIALRAAAVSMAGLAALRVALEGRQIDRADSPAIRRRSVAEASR